MKIICVNYPSIILLVNFLILRFVNADNSTLWPLIDEKSNHQDFSTVLPKPIDSTKPTVTTVVDFNDNQTSNINDSNSNKSIINQQNSLKTEIIDDLKIVDHQNQSLSDTYPNHNQTANERSRTSKRLTSGTVPFGTKLTKKPINVNLRNQTTANIDLLTNMTVISGRSAFDDHPQSKASDSYFNSDDHLTAYEKVKIKNDKFTYDNFFELYDTANDGEDKDALKSPHTSSSSSKGLCASNLIFSINIFALILKKMFSNFFFFKL